MQQREQQRPIKASGNQKRQVRIPSAIELTNLCKTFGKSGQKAVDHLSLTVRRGEIFGLLGPNGSGKTTTMNMISGLSTPTSGMIEILGYPVPREIHRVRPLLGAVPQETALYEELTAWENLDFHADLFGVPRSQKRQRIMAMLTVAQLLERKDSTVKTFSGGMKRRLAIARALLHDPQLIYLDEPTLGVDVQSRRAIWDYILALRAQGKTVLLTTNYLEEAQVLCDRIAIIDHGALIVVDTPDRLRDLYGRSAIELDLDLPIPQTCSTLATLRAVEGVESVTQQQETRLTITTIQGGTCAFVLSQVINLLFQQGYALCDLKVREPHLDEIFLQLTGTAQRDAGTRELPQLTQQRQPPLPPLPSWQQEQPVQGGRR